MFSILLIEFFAIFIIARAVDVPVTPEIATIAVHPNYEYVTTYKQVRIHYPGICEVDELQEVKIKIERIYGATIESVHEFKVPMDEREKDGAYIFGLKDAQEGKYAARVCIDDLCSPHSYSRKKIEQQIDDITCNKVSMVVYNVTTKEGKTSVYFKPDSTIPTGKFHITALPIKQLLSLEDLTEKASAPEWNKTYHQFCKHSLCYNHATHDIYLGYSYNISHYVQLFKNQQYADDFLAGSEKAAGKSVELTDEHCQSKYLLSTVVHFINSDTKEVKYRFRTTLAPKPYIIQNYIFGNKSIPVEVMYKQKLSDGLYDVWVAMCLTDKDGIESTFCTKAYVHDQFRIEDTALKMEEIKGQINTIHEKVAILKEDSSKAKELRKAQEEERVLAEYYQMVEKEEWFERFRGRMTDYSKKLVKKELKKIIKQLEKEKKQAPEGSEEEAIVEQTLKEANHESQEIENKNNAELQKWIDLKYHETTQRRAELEMHIRFLFEDTRGKMKDAYGIVKTHQDKIESLEDELEDAKPNVREEIKAALRAAERKERTWMEIYHMTEKYEWFTHFLGKATSELSQELKSDLEKIVEQVVGEVARAKEGSGEKEVTEKILQEAKNELKAVTDMPLNDLEKWIRDLLNETAMRRVNSEKSL